MNRRGPRGAPGAARLLARAPRVYVGPDALPGALEGRFGVLQGQKRPQWIEVLSFSARERPRVSELAELRFEASRSWPVVGLSLPEQDLRRYEERLLRELVPGDLILTERGASVHVGDAWETARVLRDAYR